MQPVSQWVAFFSAPRQDFSLIGMAQELLLHIRTTFCLQATFDVSKVPYFYLNLQHIFLYAASYLLEHLALIAHLIPKMVTDTFAQLLLVTDTSTTSKSKSKRKRKCAQELKSNGPRYSKEPANGCISA